MACLFPNVTLLVFAPYRDFLSLEDFHKLAQMVIYLIQLQFADRLLIVARLCHCESLCRGVCLVGLIQPRKHDSTVISCGLYVWVPPGNIGCCCKSCLYQVIIFFVGARSVVDLPSKDLDREVGVICW